MLIEQSRVRPSRAPTRRDHPARGHGRAGRPGARGDPAHARRRRRGGLRDARRRGVQGDALAPSAGAARGRPDPDASRGHAPARVTAARRPRRPLPGAARRPAGRRRPAVTTAPRVALVRRPSGRMADGIVTFVSRGPVDADLARRQHDGYVAALADAGWEVREVAPADDLPDSAFVEDTVVVCDDLAVLARPGAA